MRGSEPDRRARATAEARRWFEDAKFGLFVHWGVYSLLGKGEWVMKNDKIPIAEYEKLPPRFNPDRSSTPSEWVKLAKAAGMKYITITSKHHDGFCMFDSKLTHYDIVDATPYGKDPMKELADACHKQGIKLFFYYSLLDWHHPDYFPRGRTGQAAGRAEKGDWKPVRGLLPGPGPRALHQLRRDRRHLVRRLVGQARRRLGPRRRPTGSSTSSSRGRWSATTTTSRRSPARTSRCSSRTCRARTRPASTRRAWPRGLPLETCLTINQSWGYNARDTRTSRRPRRVIHALLGRPAGVPTCC